MRLALAFACGALFGACATDPPLRGPMAVRNQRPAQLVVLQMVPQGARPLAAGEVDLHWNSAYSSLFVSQAQNGNSFQLDGELLRTGPGAAVGLGEDLEFRFDIPFAHTSGGFLDSFVIDWHDLFGFPDQGRSNARNDQYVVQAQKNGSTVYEMDEATLELMDIPLTLSWSFLPVTDERPYGIGVRGAVDLPTGDQDRGFGNGGVDLALGLFGEYRTGCLGLTGHVEYVFANTPAEAASAGFSFEDVTSAGIEAEIALDEHWALLLQTNWNTATLRNLDFPAATSPQWLLWAGVRAALGDGFAIEAAIGEDLSPDNAPDFTLWLGLSYRFTTL